LSTGHLQEIKNKGKFQTFSYKSGRGRLREVVFVFLLKFLEMSGRVARPLTLILMIPEEVSAGCTRHDVLMKFLSALKPDEVSCIQFVPKRCVRVTFKSFEARQEVLTSGASIGSFRLTVFEADPVSVEVSLEHLPFEVPEDVTREVFSPYGTIQDLHLQNYADTGIYTGTRILKMSLVSDIPVNVRVLRYPCRVLSF